LFQDAAQLILTAGLAGLIDKPSGLMANAVMFGTSPLLVAG
jgi:hypothetical protein